MTPMRADPRKRPEAPAIREYYRDRHVRDRIHEYMTSDGYACRYLATMTGTEGPFPTWYSATRHPASTWRAHLEAGADVARSLWDRKALIVHLDVDYLNVDRPGEPFEHPDRVFRKLEPVHVAVREVLAKHELRLLTLMTGEGYHYVGHVPWRHGAIDRLAALHPPVPTWLAGVEDRAPAWQRGTIDARMARAYGGLGLAMEHLAHGVLTETGGTAPIPVVMNGAIVGRGGDGRECISIDISFAGDPLDTRHARVAFGAYQRHLWRPDIVGEAVARRGAPLVVLPRGDIALDDMLAAGRDAGAARLLARTADVRIPDAAAGVERLVDDYEAAPVARIHRQFLEPSAARTEDGPDPFAGFVPEELAPCIAEPFLAPNDRLLQPATLQHVTRGLMSLGFSPRRIADLVLSRYRADFGWGDRWTRLDAPTRAAFDVRVYSTLLLAGIDRAIDFNCVSCQEKSLCPAGGCYRDLRIDRRRLLAEVAR